MLPKNVTLSRVKSNLQANNLPKNVFNKLNALERHKRFN
jgi:hypothetical protein